MAHLALSRADEFAPSSCTPNGVRKADQIDIAAVGEARDPHRVFDRAVPPAFALEELKLLRRFRSGVAGLFKGHALGSAVDPDAAEARGGGESTAAGPDQDGSACVDGP